MLMNRRDFLRKSGAGVGIVVAAGLLDKGILAAAARDPADGKTNIKPVAVLYDATRCIGCKICEGSCRKANNLPSVDPSTKDINGNLHLSAYTYTLIKIAEVNIGGQKVPVNTKLQCMHCVHPACAEACIVGALQKTPNGPVTYDKTKCIGCRYCQVACPFGIPNFEWDKAIPWIGKCSFCADRQTAGLLPACVETCPTGALQFGDRGDLIIDGHQRIASNPGKYVEHIYGENEVGGTSWLYLSPVSFEQLGLEKHSQEPVPLNAARAMGAVPPVLLGVAAAMTGIYWLTKRRQRITQIALESQEAEGEKGDEMGIDEQNKGGY
jgi:formate dehydrogenase iron-sulfur subunit